VNNYPNYQIFNLDALTYAGNLENIADIQNAPNYTFIKGDIVDADFINDLFQKHQFDGVLHLAAESHVDRSITDPLAFVKTNVIGTMNLLNAAKTIWKDNFEGKRFYHISTDEVYGSLGTTGFLQKPLLTIQIRLILLQKQVLTILFELMEKPMVCLM
jgi:dTDP-glucose 4,6-dehydratase